MKREETDGFLALNDFGTKRIFYLYLTAHAIIPLGSLDHRRNAFINITNLIRSSSNGLG